MGLLDDITRKKRALDAARPLAPAAVRELANWFELELTAACLSLEGADLTPDEILEVLDKGVVLRNRPQKDQLLAVNHLQALQLTARLCEQTATAVTERTVMAFHKVLYAGIDPAAGRYRDGVPDDNPDGTVPDPAKARVSMSALSGWLRRVEAGHETALEAHYRLLMIRPFDQGNMAVGTLLGNLILNRAGFPPIILRDEVLDTYFEVVDRARTAGDKGPFRELLLGLLNESLDACLTVAARAAAARQPAETVTVDAGSAPGRAG